MQCDQSWIVVVELCHLVDGLESASNLGFYITFYIYIYAFSRRFYPKRLTLHSRYSF